MELLQERGLIDVPESQPMFGIAFTRLSWDGHEYLDAVQDPKVWRETKDKVENVGSWTFGW
jgi:hypothetical protein